jgi:hypothetical protein
VLQQINAQHPLDADRRAAIARLRIERLDQRAQRAPSRQETLPAASSCRMRRFLFLFVGTLHRRFVPVLWALKLSLGVGT